MRVKTVLSFVFCVLRLVRQGIQGTFSVGEDIGAYLVHIWCLSCDDIESI